MRQDLPFIGLSAKIVKPMELRGPVWASEMGLAAAGPVGDGFPRMGAPLFVLPVGNGDGKRPLAGSFWAVPA